MPEKLSIAQQRAGEKPKPATTSKEMCLAPALLDDLKRLQGARNEAIAEAYAAMPAFATNQETGEPAGPKRAGQKSPAESQRVKEIDAEIQAVYGQLQARTGTLTLEAVSPKEWREWVRSNPARKDNLIDLRLAHGYCDADALLGDMALWAKSYDAEPLDEGDLDYILETAAPADVNGLVDAVVRLHEEPTSLPKLPSVSSTSRTSESG